MNKIKITIYTLFFVISTASSSGAAISNEQKHFINSLSNDQIYDLYVSQGAAAFTIQANNKINIPDSFNRKFTMCFKKYVKNIFTPEEIRELFIQSENFDRTAADTKLKKLSPKYQECIIKGMK